QRGLSAPDRLEAGALAEPGSLFRRGGADDASRPRRRRARTHAREARRPGRVAGLAVRCEEFPGGTSNRSRRARRCVEDAGQARRSPGARCGAALLRRTQSRGNGTRSQRVGSNGSAGLASRQGVAVPRAARARGTSLTAERHARIGELYHKALERPREQRASFLDEACTGDVTLREEVASLLAADDTASGFIETPAIAVAAAHLAGDHQPLNAGSMVGPYQVQALLGRGGMGDVYRAHDPRLGRDVALKLLPLQFARDRERLARFEREARLLAALNHPNIAALYGIEESDGQRLLVLELINGATLDQRLSAGPIPLPEALDIASQIVEALGAAHDHGIVHRDLKPANIAIRPDGVAKVLDFGLAKALDTRASDAAVNISEFSDAPRVIGTPPYMSPEQARGDAGDQRIDIWAFGCVLYEMLTGRRAFDGETRSDVIAAVIERAPDWDALPAVTPMAIRRLLRRCLEKEPRDRLRHIADAR